MLTYPGEFGFELSLVIGVGDIEEEVRIFALRISRGGSSFANGKNCRWPFGPLVAVSGSCAVVGHFCH